MIDPKALLADLRKLLLDLEADLRERATEVAEVDAQLRAEFARARQGGRTGQAFELWRDDFLTQVAAAWILATVFVRFLEDNGLVDPPRLSGPEARRKRALEEHEIYFQKHPRESDREYLHDVFRQIQRLPTMDPLLGEKHNLLWPVGISGDGATKLLDFWQRIHPETGRLQHDFTDSEWSTRFLGDLYQDLSESARKKYALLQTPSFVEEFILDRTLTPAIEEFGFKEVRLIDPACGSGHFLLGAFHRLFDLWIRNEPGTNPRALAQRALDAVHGVDLNPFAVGIARFRLLLAALKASGIERLKEAPDFKIHLAVGDSLLHGPRPGTQGMRQRYLLGNDPVGHVYEVEDAGELRRILGKTYHAVVGNPPYITPKDAALNQAYRDRFGSCHKQYSLAVPFMQRFFDLAVGPEPPALEPAGFVGMITSNSFMKREFGKKLIEEFIPHWDLSHVIDTSGAYIPGHGTPTVILFGRHRQPVAPTVRAVLGIRGEPATLHDPSKGLVWTAIVSQLDEPGSQSEYVSVADMPRESFHKHPWSIGGGGAAELGDQIDSYATHTLRDFVHAIGRTTVVGEDDVWLTDVASSRRSALERFVVPFVIGECVRDWSIMQTPVVLYPYKLLGGPPIESNEFAVSRYLWPYRTMLSRRTVFGKSLGDMGRPWYEHLEHYTDKLRTPLSIAFAFVATHNHFVLDRGGKVFNRSAPVIKLPPDATEEDHLALLGLLNSSTACFWMKQLLPGKHKGDGGAAHAEPAYQRFEFDATKLRAFPLSQSSPTAIAERLDHQARELPHLVPSSVCSSRLPTRESLRKARERWTALRARMIADQEELDWKVYLLYGLVEEPLSGADECVPALELGQRAFEIVMARQPAEAEPDLSWFERHGSIPIKELPTHWPADYRALVERRIEAIYNNPSIALIEKPEYKRRWSTEPLEEQEKCALQEWLLERLESPLLWPQLRLSTCARLADTLRRDADFLQVAELYRGRADFDLAQLVAELAEEESVPFLPTLRYKPSGLEKRKLWEQCWDLQRKEDAIDARTKLPPSDSNRLTEAEAADLKKKEIGDIPVPPKYTSADFQKGHYWRLRGKLDVPKERFISYPYCERAADPSLVIAWAGWNHLQQAQALAAYYLEMKEQEGWSRERLLPLLAGLLDLVPWLKQWHNQLDAEHGVKMGDYFKTFAEDEIRAHGLSVEDVKAWTPEPRSRGRRAGRLQTTKA